MISLKVCLYCSNEVIYSCSIAQEVLITFAQVLVCLLWPRFITCCLQYLTSCTRSKPQIIACGCTYLYVSASLIDVINYLLLCLLFVILSIIFTIRSIIIISVSILIYCPSYEVISLQPLLLNIQPVVRSTILRRSQTFRIVINKLLLVPMSIIRIVLTFWNASTVIQNAVLLINCQVSYYITIMSISCISISINCLRIYIYILSVLSFLTVDLLIFYGSNIPTIVYLTSHVTVVIMPTLYTTRYVLQYIMYWNCTSSIQLYYTTWYTSCSTSICIRYISGLISCAVLQPQCHQVYVVQIHSTIRSFNCSISTKSWVPKFNISVLCKLTLLLTCYSLLYKPCSIVVSITRPVITRRCICYRSELLIVLQ